MRLTRVFSCKVYVWSWIKGFGAIRICLLFFFLIVSFIFNCKFNGRISDQHLGVIFNKTNWIFWKDVCRTIILPVSQSWSLLCIKWSLTEAQNRDTCEITFLRCAECHWSSLTPWMSTSCKHTSKDQKAAGK